MNVMELLLVTAEVHVLTTTIWPEWALTRAAACVCQCFMIYISLLMETIALKLVSADN